MGEGNQRKQRENSEESPPTSLPPTPLFPTEELRIALIPVKRTLLLLLSCAATHLALLLPRVL